MSTWLATLIRARMKGHLHLSVVVCATLLAGCEILALPFGYGVVCWRSDRYCPVLREFLPRADFKDKLDEDVLALDLSLTNISEITGPDTIVYADEVSGMRILGNLEECVTDAELKSTFTEVSPVEDSFSISPWEFEQLERPRGLGDRIAEVKSVLITADSVQNESLSDDQVLEVIRENFRYFSSQCRSWLLTENVYILRSLLRVNGLEYTLLGRFNAPINLVAVEVEEFYMFSESVTQDEIVLKQRNPRYLGIYDALPIRSTVDDSPRPLKDVMRTYYRRGSLKR